MRHRLLILLFLGVCLSSMASNVVWFDGQHPVSYQLTGRVDPVVKQALRMFCDDMQLVTGMKPVASREAAIRIIQGNRRMMLLMGAPLWM